MEGRKGKNNYLKGKKVKITTLKYKDSFTRERKHNHNKTSQVACKIHDNGRD